MGANLLRRYIDPSVYSTSKSAFDLISNSVRQSLIYNAYEGKTIFNAVVLTTPVVLSELDLNYRGPVASSGADRISRFVFKGRIMAEPGMPSPHEFLPDPCALDIGASQLATAMETIALHTTFISSTQQETSTSGDYTKPKVGDKVRVELQGNVFSYNLQVGTFLEVVTDSTISGRRTQVSGSTVNVEDRSRSECIVLSDLFDAQEENCRTDYKDCLENMSFKGEAVNIIYGVGGAAASEGTPFFPLLLEFGEIAYMPADGRLSSPWLEARPPPAGGGAIRPHHGIDIAKRGYPTGLYAIADGKIDSISLHPDGKCGTNGGGTIITISHPGLKNVKKTRYMHIHKVNPMISRGDTVTAGQNIATMGTTGCSTGVHLHFEVYNSAGKNVDPIQSLGWDIAATAGKFHKCHATMGSMGGKLAFNLGDQSHIRTDQQHCNIPVVCTGCADYFDHAR
jgi:hypothetical protein